MTKLLKSLRIIKKHYTVILKKMDKQKKHITLAQELITQAQNKIVDRILKNSIDRDKKLLLRLIITSMKHTKKAEKINKDIVKQGKKTEKILRETLEQLKNGPK